MSDNILTYSQPAGGFAAISKYNPHLWSAEQLRAIFVARKNELADLQHTLRKTPSDTVGQHILLVGARGMGKSTLMRRLALAVEDDPDLSTAWLPLRFPEEQYTVATLGQFWANVLDSLADALQHLGHSVSELDAAAERIAALPTAEQATAFLAAIDRCADERRQRLLLLVDNTDLLLHNIGRDAHWALRATLQSNPRLFWVGGSYQSLEADSDYHDAFLDFFRVITLRPLRLEEMAQALEALAETFGGEVARQEMARQLAAQPERLPTLRQLSGGNPRTTVMLYEILANGQNGSVRSDLEALLDNMTPLYKARMDSLADLPRKLFAHILEYWAPISVGELASVSQVLNTSISPQLKRLELDGLIEKTTLHGTTRSGYQAADRFFNIWYLMRFSSRRQRSRLGWLVEFMRLWFSRDELCTLAQQRMHDGQSTLRSNHDREYDRALADALPDQAPERHSLRWSLLKQLKAQSKWPQDAVIAYRCAWLLHTKLGCYEEAEAAYRHAIALDEKDAYPLTNLARLLARLGRKAEAESFYRETVSQATKDNQELLLQAHLFLGNRQLAIDALQALATATQGGNQHAFFLIKEQVWECHELGLGERLADWMAESPAAGFLAPFIQALYTLADAKGKLRNLPQESQQMADEIVRLARLWQEKK